ncbi:MAG: hypothetical protein LAT58_06640 [Opitutales bacterium]|nr:hypothetical protein [Opitutales bacterium]
MNTQQGHFDNEKNEYVITDPATPRPWHNYLVSDDYLVNLTQHGTGASFWQPVEEGLRVNVTEDKDGHGGPRFVYLRDQDSGEYWSLTGAPDFNHGDDWECRVGLGYQINRSTRHGIHASWRTFVPEGKDRCEYWSVTLRNDSAQTRRISAIPYLEMHLTGGSTLMDFIAVLGGHYDPDLKAVLGINSCVKFPPDFKAFLASDTKVDGMTVSRDEFLGPYRTYANPLAVEKGTVENPEAGTEWLGASVRNDLTIEPGKSITVHYLIGVFKEKDEARERIQRLLAEGEPDRQFAKLKESTESMVGHLTVQTPDPQFDRWVNIWLKHQLAFVARWGRVIGRGFRDVLQDVLGHRITDPRKARECILEVFAKQFPDGRCIRAWRLPNAQLDVQHYADSPSWMIMALSFYLKETGDFSILEERVSYLNPEDPHFTSEAEGTVWEHVVLAQDHLLAHRGSHGLSKIYYGDWCDTMNGVGARGEGESVMLSFQVKWGCDLLADLAERLEKNEVADRMKKGSAALHEAIQTSSWDGKWFLRAFDDDGIPVGSDNPPESDEGEGRIFLNPQSWSVISGVATEEQSQSAIDCAMQHLHVGYGMVLNWPAFTSLKPRIGQMTAMTPGFYENASVYVHGNCFWIYALATDGRADQAWNAIKEILPDTDNKPNTDTEPFTIPNYYIGPNVERRRERNLFLSGWRTGSASWIYQTAIERILGLEAHYDGLLIRPALPSDWTTASAERPFRGRLYKVTYEKPEGEANTIQSITVNGESIDGPLIPLSGQPGDTLTVNVKLTS